MIVIDQGGEWLWQKVQNIPNSLKRMQYSKMCIRDRFGSVLHGCLTFKNSSLS